MSEPRAFGWVTEERCFRLLAPLAAHVELIERRHPARQPQRTTAMRRLPLRDGVADDRDGDVGVWQVEIDVPLGFYRYRIHLGWGTLVICDPWSRAVVRRKKPGHPGWSVAVAPLPPASGGVTIRPDAAVLIETHLADATMHPSAGTVAPGTYAGFAEHHAAAVGGARHALSLAVDAVELLPVTSWPVYEDGRAEHSNHWGYMPSFFLAVSERFSADWAATAPSDWVGLADDGTFADPARELRAMVDSLHSQGLGVVVDLVYNHVSSHDNNPLLQLDPGSWFHRDDAGQLRSHSGCGNDLNTATPAMRDLVVASVRRWFAEIGVDGVRLDLAELLDDRALIEIRDAARAIRPDALLIAEPWSLGGYRPTEIAALGWTVWNDRYRNALKGAEPGSPGLLSPIGVPPGAAQALARQLAGDDQASGGALATHNHGLSYLVAHDGYTLADFWRLRLGERAATVPVRAEALVDLSPALLTLLRLSGAVLLATRGPVMLHLGQSWGRAKVRRLVADDPGTLDENSYDRDDVTNYIDWQHRTRNPDLVAWLCAWVEARRRWLRPAFERPQRVHPLIDARTGAAGYVMDNGSGHVAFAVNPSKGSASLPLPGEPWRLALADAGVSLAAGEQTWVQLPPQSVALLLSPLLPAAP